MQNMIHMQYIWCYDTGRRSAAMFSFLKRGDKKLGLALGGGAARGLAHLGVLKVLEEESVAISFVAGTSAGSLIGALFCAGYGWKEIRDIAVNVKWADLVALTIPKLGLVKTIKLQELLDDLLEGKDFDALKIPFRAVAVDIQRGEQVVLSTGSVATAVRASCSIPAIFEPLPLDGRLLVDGGLLNDVPADVVRDMGADLVLAVDLNARKVIPGEPDNILEVLYRCINILINYNRQQSKEVADFYVAPDVTEFGYEDLGHLEELIERGEQAMRAQLSGLRKKA
jgi:NTE family protein